MRKRLTPAFTRQLQLQVVHNFLFQTKSALYFHLAPMTHTLLSKTRLKSLQGCLKFHSAHLRQNDSLKKNSLLPLHEFVAIVQGCTLHFKVSWSQLCVSKLHAHGAARWGQKTIHYNCIRDMKVFFYAETSSFYLRNNCFAETGKMQRICVSEKSGQSKTRQLISGGFHKTLKYLLKHARAHMERKCRSLRNWNCNSRIFTDNSDFVPTIQVSEGCLTIFV